MQLQIRKKMLVLGEEVEEVEEEILGNKLTIPITMFTTGAPLLGETTNKITTGKVFTKCGYMMLSAENSRNFFFFFNCYVTQCWL